MNKRCIDFVPAKKQNTGVNTPVRVVHKTNIQPRAAVVKRTTVTRTTTTSAVAQPINTTKATPAERKLPTEKKPVLGVVEDLNTHFVKTDVPKRPLSEKPTTVTKPTKAQVAEAKQQKVKARVLKPATKKPASNTVKSVEKPVEKSTYKPPKSPFINQNKVVKRPLSGNIYRKEIANAVKEEPKGPVTIIAKPEKDRHIGIIVTIIITIILGAAAGTVAFLLLPK